MSTKDELEQYFTRDVWEKEADQQLRKDFAPYNMNRDELKGPENKNSFKRNFLK